MRRFLVRLSVLAGIVVLGLIAVTQAQRVMKHVQDQQAESDLAASSLWLAIPSCSCATSPSPGFPLGWAPA